MASKNINVLLSLVDRFTAPLRKPVEKTKEMERQIKKSSNAISNFGRGANNRFLSLSSSIARVGVSMAGLASFASIGAITAYADKAIEAAEKEIQVQTKLKTILSNVDSIRAGGDGAVEAASKQLNDYAGNLGKVGAVSKGTILNGMQQLATFQLNADQISLLSDGMADLLAQQKGINATGEDAIGIANLIGKAMTGNAGALSKYGITMSDAEKETIKNGTAMEKAATIATVLKNNVGGVNKALGETPEGKIAKTNRQYAAMAKDLGMMILPIKAKFVEAFGAILPIVSEKMHGVFAQVAQIMDKLVTWFQQNGDVLANALGNGLNMAVTAFSILGNAIIFFLNNANVLVPVLSAIVGGFVAFNVASTVVGVVKGITGAMKGAQTAMAAFNAVMAANPAVLIALAIAALIGLVVLLVMHWDEVKTAVESFGASAMGVIDGVIQWFVNLGQAISNSISSAIDVVSGFAISLVTSISDAINSVINAFFDWVVGVGEAILAMMMSIIEFGTFLASSAVEFVSSFLDPFSGIIDGVSEIFNGITDFIVGVFTGNWEQAISGLVQIFDGYFEVIRSIAEGVIGYISDRISAIGDKLEAAKNWITGGGGGDSQPDGLATGTPYFKGGDTYVNEGSRGELITLPSGSTIVPHDLSKQIVGNTNGGITVNLTINGNMIGNEEFMNECGQHITDKILLAMNNM